MKFEFYLAYFFLTFPIDPPESIKKRLIFRNDQNTKETLGRNELKWFAESYRAIVYSAQRKITNLHLIPWCGNFVERHSFRIVFGNSLRNMWKLGLSTKFPHQKIS